MLVLLGVALPLVTGCADVLQGRRDIAGADKCPQGSAMGIDRPAKIGVGAWEAGPPGWAANRVGALGVAWHYVWGPQPLTSDGHEPQPEFVPMIWDAACKTIQGRWPIYPCRKRRRFLGSTSLTKRARRK